MHKLPLTIEDWIMAYLGGASARTLLHEAMQALRAHADDATWIHLASDAQLEQQLSALDAQATADAATRLAALPLYGVPFAVKDNIDVAGMPTTAACPAYARDADTSATVVRRLQAAGAVCVGKTNLDQFATGLVGTRSPYGAPASAFSDAHVSGGSSSGSARAVAKGWLPFTLGTDTAGSGRVPAGFNQLVGLKPTPGRVSTAGVLPACRSIDCVSVFALTARDAARVLAVIEGPDPLDAYSADIAGPAQWSGPLRVGVPRAPQFDEADYAAGFERAGAHLRALGHEVVALDFADLERTAALLYDGPWVAERHAVVQSLLDEQPDALDPTVRQVIGAARRYDATDAFRGQYALRDLQRDTAAIWHGVDVLMVPTAPGHPRFEQVTADPVGANSRLGTYTNFVNLLGWCALAMPFERSAQGMPFGVTFIAPAGQDCALARFGDTWQASLDLPLGATGQHRTHGGIAPVWPRAEDCLPIAVVGAHLSGMPLNGQLLERGARLLETTTTAARYHLHALPGTRPPKPGLIRSADTGHAIAVEVWDMPMRHVGSFLALIPPPLGLGSIELADGRWVHGFICESLAVADAPDVSHHGGWRAYIASLAAPALVSPSPTTLKE